MLLAPAPRSITTTPARLETQAVAPITRIDPHEIDRAQGYRLTLSTGGLDIVGHDAAGVFYAEQTWAQLRRTAEPRWGGDGTLPCLTIEDWPDFPVRGVMLDISRDKVPTMATLLALVNQLAHHKINQLQLYTEHTFAYEGHETVWSQASPFTPEEVRQLDAYCAERFVELVPNQNCFGHMERWLKHEAYQGLSERPEFKEGDDVPAFYVGRVERGEMGHAPGMGSTLCPVEPKSLELIDDLFAQLLPCFNSKLVNVGGDETFDLGLGRSRNACETKGKGRVYLEYLQELHQRAAAHGSTMQFWGDMAWHHPELLAEVKEKLPGAIALNWGYEKHQTFEKEAKLCADAGVPFYVCPATATFNTMAGRYDTAVVNQQNAGLNGNRYGAVGYLNTWWGDWGHWQAQSANDPALIIGAAVSWCHETNDQLDLKAALSRYVYDDPTGKLAEALEELGGVERDCADIDTPNVLNWAFILPERPIVDRRLDRGWDQIGPFSDAALDAIEARVGRGVELLRQAQPACADASAILTELNHAARMILHQVRNVRSRIQQQAPHHADLDAATRKAYDAELSVLVDEFRTVWRTRNREGGLVDTVTRLEMILAGYRAQ